jgi:hypothetical protein
LLRSSSGSCTFLSPSSSLPAFYCINNPYHHIPISFNAYH